MIMNYLRPSIIITILLCLFASPAVADFYLGVEIPLAYDFKEADDGSNLEADGRPSGYILLAQLPFFSGGVGLESYNVGLDQQAGNTEIALLLVDVFYLLPIPIIDISLGLGYGTVEVKGDNASYYEQSTSSQYFLRVGVPIGVTLKIIGSYHNVFARVKTKDTDSLLEAGGTMTTIGVAVGF